MMKNERSTANLESDILRTFVAVAMHGNVTRAADALHRTQSAISVQIKHLEDNLQVTLFTREARGVSLTSAGEKLLASAKPILQMLDRAAAELRQNPIEGTVRVGIPDDYGTDLLSTILADFAQSHPLVEVSIRCEFSVGFPKAVKTGDLDIAVFACDRGFREGEVLYEEPTVWVGNRNIAIHQYDPLPVTLFDRACWWRDAAIEALNSASIPYRMAYSSGSVAGIKAAIGAGLAIGVLAESTVDPGMKILGHEEGLPPLPFSNLVLISGRGGQTRAVTAMADSLRRGFLSLASF